MKGGGGGGEAMLKGYSKSFEVVLTRELEVLASFCEGDKKVSAL